jgi:hypothetical protein
VVTFITFLSSDFIVSYCGATQYDQSAYHTYCEGGCIVADLFSI